MRRLMKRRTQKVGLPPGSIVFVGEKKTDKVVMTLFDYDDQKQREKTWQSVEECFPLQDKPSVTWINIDGLQDVETIKKIDTHFGIHPLVLEDIVNTQQRPKIEDYGDYLFIVLKMLYKEAKNNEICYEHISLILGTNYVISFQEAPGGDVFDPIRDRIRQNKGRIRKMKADYLAYALMDMIVDNYFLILESVAEEVDHIENKLMDVVSFETFGKIHHLKRNMLFLRKAIWPLREVIGSLQRAESKIIREETGIYWRDLYDHTIEVIDLIETFRDMLSGMLEIYLSSMSNRMNEVMKFLTVISTVFIPVTFIAGVYGMNFKHMPELEFRFGYFFTLGVMFLLGICMVIYFKKKKWL